MSSRPFPIKKISNAGAPGITQKKMFRYAAMPSEKITIRPEKNTLDFFQRHVKKSLQNQHIEITALSEQYLVHLLADFALTCRAFSLTSQDERPLALIYHHAQFETFPTKIKIFKELGDFSLFVSGFFPDSFNRKLNDVDYYMSLGKGAYRTLSSLFEKFHHQDFNLLFHELAEKFVALTDILAEISSESFTKWNDGILRLYERWLKTRSKRDERLLSTKGIIPNHLLPSKTIQ